MPIPWNLIIPAAAAIGGGAIAANAAGNAADTQAASAAEANALNREQFEYQKGLYAPYADAGYVGLNELRRGLGLPGYTGQSPATAGQQSQFTSPLLGSAGPQPQGSGILKDTLTYGPLGAASNLFHRDAGRADQLTPYQGQIDGEIQRINKAVEQGKAAGTLTQQDLQQALNTVQALRGQFSSAASQFGVAGQQGLADYAKYYDPLEQSWQEMLPGLPQAGNVPQGTPEGGQGAGFGEFNQFTANTKPFGMEDFTQSPSYQFRLKEGQRLLEASRASRGLLQSGGTAKALVNYGQNMAGQEFERERGYFDSRRDSERAYADSRGDLRVNRLLSLAGLGQTATSQGINASSGYANNAMDLTTGVGNARAAAQAAQGSIYGGLVSNIGADVGDYFDLRNRRSSYSNINL